MKRGEPSILIIIVTIVCMLGAPLPACAEEPVGSVVALQGEVSAIDGSGAVRRLSMKAPVYVQDTIRTGKAGRVQLLFSDNTIISLGRTSSLEVSHYLWDQKNRSGAMKTTVHEGVFRVMGGALTKHSPSTFRTETPAGTIGVRGSMYSGILSDGSLLVSFEGGRGIDVTNAAGSVAITVPGFGTRIASSAAAPEPPSRLTPDEVDAINSELESDVPEAGDTEENDVQERSPEDRDTGSADAGEGGDAGEPVEASGQDAPTVPSDDSTISPSAADMTLDMDETALPMPDAQPASTVTVQTTDLNQQVSDITDTTAQDSQQQDVQDTIQNTGVQMSGLYMNAVIEGLDDPTINGTRSYGDTGAVSLDDTVTGSATSQDGATYSFTFAVNPYDADATYVNPDPLSTVQNRTVTLMGASQTFEADVFSANTGAFTIFAVKEAAFAASTTYRFSELGYAGVPSATVPTDGVYSYFGPALGFKEAPDEMSASTAKFAMEVNWHNGKAIGMVHPTASTDPTENDSWGLIIFGDVQGASLTNIMAFGTDAPTNPSQDQEIDGMSGDTGSGQFYGTQIEGFGMTGRANIFSIQSDQTQRTGIGHIIAAGLREYEPGVDEVAPTGTVLFQGFVLGMSEDMSQPGENRRLFMNSSPEEFTITADRDAGTLSGSITAHDIVSSDNSINQLSIGGSNGSAYVLDDNYVAVLGDTTGSSIVSGTSAGGLKPVGNFLVTGDIDKQFSDYVTWGYWEIAYVDPASSADYHLHRPGSLWIAGNLTPASAMDDLISTSFTGRYQGGAEGIRIDSGGFVTQLTGGTTDITVNLSPGATNPLSGAITFDQVILGLTGGFVSASSPVFGAEITGAASSSVSGAFFGNNANAIGGNFRAQMMQNSYYGIFGGDR